MEVKIIKANTPTELSSKRKIERLRVAAYCRVSTDDEDQTKSYQSMIKYYTDLIQNNKQWVFAGIFADKAITGTKADIREEFQRLIQECLSGKIDLVIAKSIPRFARNTLDTLKYVRMLKERNVAVYFEVEKINTLKDGEFLLTILSSVAQQEVGYIFKRYVAGAGSTMIARELNEQEIPTVHGNRWSPSSVMGIINNEKYMGDLLLGKSFTVDPISKRRLTNMGEEDRFYIENHHEAIISKEIFEKAQEIRQRRSKGRVNGVETGKREKYSRQYAFSSMLECGFCGETVSRRCWHSHSKYEKIIWHCGRNIRKGKRFCPEAKGIPEQVIEKAFVESYQMLCSDHKDVLEEFIKRIEETLSGDSIKDRIKKIDQSIRNLKYRRRKLLDKYLDGGIAKDIYEETDLDLDKKIFKANQDLIELEQQYNSENSLQKRLKDFKKALLKNQTLEEFDREIFESIVEKVIIGGYDENGKEDPYKIIFIYKTGFKDEIENAKKRYENTSGRVDGKLCSYITSEVKDLYPCNSDNTHRPC